MEYAKKRVLNKAIPDNDPNGLMDIINVHRDLTVKAVDVHVNIEHPYNGDISLELTDPSGAKKTIHSPSRVPGKNINKHFNGDMMSAFLGKKSKGEWRLKIIDSGARDDGKLIDWTLSLTVANSKTSEIFILDKKELKSVQSCHQGGKIQSMTAHLNIDHSHIGDLTCQLVSPSGKSVTLHNKAGGNQKGLKKTYSSDDLKDFNGLLAKGKWKLLVNDNLKGDNGKIIKWGLNIKTSTASEPQVSTKPDDLTKVEGVGPKIAELLNADGISTFKQLSQAQPAALKDMLVNAGPRFKMHNPGSWPQQAALAAAGKWKELDKLQDQLDGGK